MPKTDPARSVAGLRQDITEAWGEDCPCSVVTALVVNACFGGEILSYDLGLRGCHYLNRITDGGQEFCVDLTRDRVFADWIAPSEATVCTRDALTRNDDTFRQFSRICDRLHDLWNGINE